LKIRPPGDVPLGWGPHSKWPSFSSTKRGYGFRARPRSLGPGPAPPLPNAIPSLVWGVPVPRRQFFCPPVWGCLRAADAKGRNLNRFFEGPDVPRKIINAVNSHLTESRQTLPVQNAPSTTPAGLTAIYCPCSFSPGPREQCGKMFPHPCPPKFLDLISRRKSLSENYPIFPWERITS